MQNSPIFYLIKKQISVYLRKKFVKMKKLFLGAVVIAALAFYQKANSVENVVNDIVGISEIESLARSEAGSGEDDLDCRWARVPCEYDKKKTREVCIDGGTGNGCACGEVSRDC